MKFPRYAGRSRGVMLPLLAMVLLVIAVAGMLHASVRRPKGVAEGVALVREDRPVQEMILPAGNNPARLDEGSVFFIGNATVLIRYAGFTILTDPNFLHAGNHVHLGYGLHAKRLTNPAMEMDRLPPIDFVVLSHMHGDHFDQLVEAKFNRDVPIITTPQAIGRLKKLGFKKPVGLETWETLSIRKGDATLQLTAMPGKHGPGPTAAALPQIHGHMLDFQDNKQSDKDQKALYRIYISGDTLLFDDLKKIPQRYPDIDLGLFHLGGTRVLGLTVTMDAKQGVKAVQLIAPHTAIPIHYNDYDRFKSPLSDFRKEVRAAGLEDKVRYLKHGESYVFHPPAKIDHR